MPRSSAALLSLALLSEGCRASRTTGDGGAGCQTTPKTDDGLLVSRVQAYGAAGGQAPCP